MKVTILRMNEPRPGCNGKQLLVIEHDGEKYAALLIDGVPVKDLPVKLVLRDVVRKSLNKAPLPGPVKLVERSTPGARQSEVGASRND